MMTNGVGVSRVVLGWRRAWLVVAFTVVGVFLALAGLGGDAGAQAGAPLWSQLGVDIDGEAIDDESGTSVAFSADGSRVAIGAPLNGGGSPFAGQVRVFDWNGSAWLQVGGDIDGEAPSDRSGISVALSADGSRVAIGATGNDGTASLAGHVRVFDLVGSAWVQVGGDIDAEAESDSSGSSVALSADGSRVAIGATANREVGFFAGHVRVFDLVGSAWVQVGDDIDGASSFDRSGVSVALSADGSRVAIGSYQHFGSKGHVRVFDLVGSAWVQAGGDIDGVASGDEFGASVALSADGSRVAIGAPSNAGNGVDAGHVRVFDFIGVVWVKVGGDIEGEAAGDQSGGSVALSADGSRVAIGARFNAGTGADAGHVRMFDLVASAWVQIGDDIDGEAAGDESGASLVLSGGSVALSADGSRVAIGARLNAGNGVDAGHVRVFEGPGPEFCDGQLVTINMNLGVAGTGSGGVDVILGTPGDDVIRSLGGDDTICGGDGDDVIRSGAGVDRVFGETGDDTIFGGGGGDTIDGGDGEDELDGQGGTDMIFGGPDDDEIDGRGAADTIDGGDGDDTINGQNGLDTMNGGLGDDTIRGQTGPDVLHGDDGGDDLFGGEGGDTLYGGSGTDKCAGNTGPDQAEAATCESAPGVESLF